ncbi:MAG: FkbM family methyltransferase [Spirulina sp. SIO3F2]|nr:FkbM family methyltransferase [Spirulina sp. SIO3F2]
MRVEACCQALLSEILPHVDPQQQGHCIDVGVGTFAFYCERFAQLGFPTIAVEPMPIDQLKQRCQKHKIRLIEACLSDRTGSQTLYSGRFARFGNLNFNSLDADWFGSSAQAKEVPTYTLAEFLRVTNVTSITCLKLDIEGWEPKVLGQLPNLAIAARPKLVMFEYGGGSPRHRQKKGWSPKFLAGTMQCLEALQHCGYGFSIMVDFASDAQVRCFDLQAVSLNPDEIFATNAVYGNIISFYGCDYDEAAIAQTAAKWQGGLFNWIGEKLFAR